MTAAHQPCFHCHEPVLDPGRWQVSLDGQSHDVCCPGCEAVFNVIHGAGLDAYYRHREAPGARRDKSNQESPGTALVFGAFTDDQCLEQFCTKAGSNGADASAATTYDIMLQLDGLRCSACVWLIEQGLLAVRGVSRASVNFGNARCRVRFDAQQTGVSAVVARIEALGYSCAPVDQAAGEQAFESQTRAERQRLFVAGLAMMQAMMFALPGYLVADGAIEPVYVSLLRWAGFAVVAPTLLFSGWPIIAAAWRNTMQWRADMDTPVAIVLLIAFTASAITCFTGQGEVYFDSIAMFLFLLLGARYLERLARRRATRAARNLELMVPDVADQLHPDGSLTRVPAASLAPGDHVRVAQGERVPADAVVTAGASAIDQSLISGESEPVVVSVNDSVPGGAVVCGAPLTLCISRTSARSTLSLIRELADRGLSDKPRMVKLADWIAARFVLGVLGLSVLVALAWWLIDPPRALPVAVAVMVIACPCALSLATPAALAAATDSLLRTRVLVTRGHVFQRLAQVTDVVLDKTGTLTEGRPEVAELQYARGATPHQQTALLALVKRALESDTHPMAGAIVRYAGRQAKSADDKLREGLSLIPEKAEPGAGIRVRVSRDDEPLTWLTIGSAAWCQIAPDALSGWRQAASDPFVAASEVFVSVSGHWPAWLGEVFDVQSGDRQTADNSTPLMRFSLRDRLREDAVQMISQLRGRGLAVHLLTGDRLPPAQEVARQLGISQVVADATPAEKSGYVARLQAQGRVVMMAGDGINDAPVLARADVSVAIGRASSLARQTADVVCLGEPLAALALLPGWAQRTMRIVRQNIGWAVSYNTGAIPLAALGLVPPELAAVGMALSSILVVGNSMRLLRLHGVAAPVRNDSLNPTQGVPGKPAMDGA